MSAPKHQWIDELVRTYIGAIDDVTTLRQWISLCHERIESLGHPPFYGIDTTRTDKPVRINGERWRIVGTRRTSDSGTMDIGLIDGDGVRASVMVRSEEYLTIDLIRE